MSLSVPSSAEIIPYLRLGILQVEYKWIDCAFLLCLGFGNSDRIEGWSAAVSLGERVASERSVCANVARGWDMDHSEPLVRYRLLVPRMG